MNDMAPSEADAPPIVPISRPARTISTQRRAALTPAMHGRWRAVAGPACASSTVSGAGGSRTRTCCTTKGALSPVPRPRTPTSSPRHCSARGDQRRPQQLRHHRYCARCGDQRLGLLCAVGDSDPFGRRPTQAWRHHLARNPPSGADAPNPPQGQAGFIAIEWWPDDFAAIRYAVEKGIIVVEAGGNGAENLDAAIYDSRPVSFPAVGRTRSTRQSVVGRRSGAGHRRPDAQPVGTGPSRL